MQDKIKNKVITIGFTTILVSIFITNILSKDKLISETERRKLTQKPEITIDSIKNGEISKSIDKYVTDQFVARQTLREIKAIISLDVLKQKDNNNLFEKNGAIYKMDYPLNEENLQKSLNKIDRVYNKYLKGMNVYYAIIPDKNYYLKDDDHLRINYEEIWKTTKENLKEMKYIDIRNSLRLEDYYKTDLHWKQEKLQKVVATIQEGMNVINTSGTNYEIEERGEFYGAYYGQIAKQITKDKLYVLSNETIEKCITYNYETKENGKIYENPKTADKYDTYLSGAVSLIEIQNPNANTEKELLLFRDSFGSSLAPLLVENYKKVTLIDLRYISSDILDSYIEFNNQDVLFLYSTLYLTSFANNL